MGNDKSTVCREDWARMPGDFFDVAAAVRRFDFDELTPEDFFEAGKRDYREAINLADHPDYNESWDDQIDTKAHIALVKVWIAASGGHLNACHFLGHEILKSITLDPPVNSIAQILSNVANQWIALSDGSAEVTLRGSEKLKLRNPAESLEDFMRFDPDSEEEPRHRVSRAARSEREQRRRDKIKAGSGTREQQSGDVPDGVVVVPDVGDSSAGEGANLLKRYNAIVGVALPSKRVDMPVDGEVERGIVGEWPWAAKVAEHIERMLQVQRVIGLTKPILPPMLFVGPSGSGKTALSVRVAEIFGVPSHVVAVGGQADAAGLAPVARGWSNARACGPVLAALRHECCDPAIILDELDKSQAVDARNGSVAGTLLSMMGMPESYEDSCLLTNVNLSKMLFMATSNSIKAIPVALLDRFTVFHVPRPSADHFATVLESCKRRYAKEMGVLAEALPSLNYDEYEVLKRQFSRTDASLRDFARAYRHMLSEAAQRIEIVRQFMN